MDEKERLRQIRQQQMHARDPGDSKIKGYDWSTHNKKAKRIAAQKRKQQQRFILFEIWDILPGRWKGVAYGLLFGGVIAAILLLFLPAEWRGLVLLPLLICAIGGMVLGKTMEDDIL